MPGFRHVTSSGYKLGTGGGQGKAGGAGQVGFAEKTHRNQVTRNKLKFAKRPCVESDPKKPAFLPPAGRPKKFQFFGRCLLLSALVNL
jgi:hypothetical protein